jgi:hypothetical protein
MTALIAGPTQKARANRGETVAVIEDTAYIEDLAFNERIRLAVNEDGRRLNLPRNFLLGSVMILGTALFHRVVDGEIVDMTDPDIATAIRFFADRDDLRKRDNLDRCFMCDRINDGTPHDCPAERRV